MLIWLSIQVYQIIHLIRNLRTTKHEVALAESGEAVLELLRSRAMPQSKRTRLRPSVSRAVHIILWKEGASRSKVSYRQSEVVGSVEAARTRTESRVRGAPVGSLEALHSCLHSDGWAFAAERQRRSLGNVTGMRMWSGAVWMHANNRFSDWGIVRAAETAVYGPEG
jgi:hypothetical protein